MKSNIFFQTNDNNYFINKSIGQSSIVHDLIMKMYTYEEKNKRIDKSIFYESYSSEDVDYYYKKYLFLKDNNIISNTNLTKYKLEHIVSSNDVEQSLINTNQLTFEVTEKCNLKCEYCAYGPLYNSYDTRYDKTLSISKVVRFLDYFVELRKSKNNFSFKKVLYISFYGGEPLLNMNFIKDVVNYFKDKSILVKFSMTTNGLLLEKTIDFLVKNDFNILISIDGSEKHNIYRKLKNGKSSFAHVFKMIKYIQSNFSDFFMTNISFASVITNYSNEDEIKAFFLKEFNKNSMYSELNPSGIDEEKKEEFNEMFKPISVPNKIEAIPENAVFVQASKFLRTDIKVQLNSFATSTIDDKIQFKPTGTCLPFSKRVFITSQGYILACEKIDHKYKLGFVNERKLELNFSDISTEYSDMLSKAISICKNCYRQTNCPKCLLYTEHVEKECDMFLNFKNHKKELTYYFTLLENNPKIISDSFEKLIFD